MKWAHNLSSFNTYCNRGRLKETYQMTNIFLLTENEFSYRPDHFGEYHHHNFKTASDFVIQHQGYQGIDHCI